MGSMMSREGRRRGAIIDDRRNPMRSGGVVENPERWGRRNPMRPGGVVENPERWGRRNPMRPGGVEEADERGRNPMRTRAVEEVDEMGRNPLRSGGVVEDPERGWMWRGRDERIDGGGYPTRRGDEAAGMEDLIGYGDYIRLPLGASSDNFVVLIPSTMIGGGAGSVGGGGYTRERLPLRGAFYPGPGAGIPPIVIMSSASAKSSLEKAWDLIQTFYAIFILASYQYVNYVQDSLKTIPWARDSVLMTFGVLWCLFGFGYHLHFYAKESRILQKATAGIARIYGILFSLLLMMHIYGVIDSKEQAKIWFISNLFVLFVGHTMITIWSCCKDRTRSNKSSSLLPITAPRTTANEGTWAANRPPYIPPTNHVPNSVHIWPVENSSSYGVGNVEANMNTLAGSRTRLQRSSLPEHRSSVSSNGAGPADKMQGNVNDFIGTGVRLQRSPLPEHSSSVSSNGVGSAVIMQGNGNGLIGTSVHTQGSPLPDHRRSDCRSGATNMTRDNNVLATSSPRFYKSLPLEHKSNGVGSAVIMQGNDNGLIGTSVHTQGSPLPDHRRSDSDCRSGATNMTRDNNVLATSSPRFYKSLPLEHKRVTEDRSLLRLNSDREFACDESSPRQKSD